MFGHIWSTITTILFVYTEKYKLCQSLENYGASHVNFCHLQLFPFHILCQRTKSHSQWKTNISVAPSVHAVWSQVQGNHLVHPSIPAPLNAHTTQRQWGWNWALCYLHLENIFQQENVSDERLKM